MLTRTKQEQRKKDFKKGIDSEDARRKREESAVEIRKNKRDAGLQQKRRTLPPTTTAPSSITTPSDAPANPHGLPQYAAAVFSQDPTKWLDAVVCFRKLLSIERNPPIQEVIDTGVIPRFVQFLQMNGNQKLQFESAWALTNIASGTSEQTQELLRHGAVGVFVQLLGNQDEELREQAVWALGNIAGDSPRCRDFVLSSGALGPVLVILQNPGKQTMIRNATWALSNFCRGKPQPAFSSVASALPVLARLIHSSDTEVVIDACWALSYLSDGTEENIQAVLNAGVAHKLVELLTNASHSIQTPALRTVGNIVTGNDEQTQAIIDLRTLPILYQLIQSNRKALRKEACWTISNITAGNKEQTQTVINANLLPGVVHLLENGEFDVKKEAAWALSNATTWKNPDQIKYLVSIGVIKGMCQLLKVNDAKTVGVAMDALDNILSIGEKISKSGENPYTSIVEENEGIDRLEELQAHENVEIYDKAVKMLERYFAAEEEDENLAPNVATNQPVFSFGTNFTAPTTGFSF